MGRGLGNALHSWRPSTALTPVERYGRFEILGRIGRGGMAEILLARERALLGGFRHVVLKRMLPEVADNNEVLGMFLDEARMVMGLSHPNLCQIYDVGEQDGSWYIAMEWVNGTTLHELLRRAASSPGLDVQVMASIISQCAEALHHAHHARDGEGRALQLVHRDVSPHNVMVAFDGRVKLLDFGIAKSAVSTHQTEAGVVKGKVCYLAPEQWTCRPLDARTDVFALGCCLFEALSGRVVFRRDTQAEVMQAVLYEGAPRLAELVPSLPTALSDIANKALALDPADRFQSALEMSDTLERFLAAEAGPVRASRIAGYVRSLFPAEVELGPVLERGLRGAMIEETAFAQRALLPSLPPLPVALRGLAQPRRLSTLPPRADVPMLPGASWATLDMPLGEDAAFPMFSDLPAALVVTPPANEQGVAPAPAVRRLGPIARGVLLIALFFSFSAASWWLVAEGSHSPLQPLPEANVAPPPSMAALRDAPAGASGMAAAVSDTLPFTRARPAHGELLFEGAESQRQPEVGMPKSFAAGAKAKAPHESASAARLAINTKPWSRVYLGKRLLGTTPLANVAVPAGTLTLRLVDRDGAAHLRRVVQPKRGLRTVFFDFENEHRRPVKKRAAR